MGTRHIYQYIKIAFSCKNIEPKKKEIKKAIPFPTHQKLKYLNLMHKNYTLKAAKNNRKKLKNSINRKSPKCEDEKRSSNTPQ